MGFLAGYRAQLKPLAVEEPIDVVWHRLLAYGLTRLLYPTPVSADAITVFAILVGFASGACIAIDFPHHLVAGAVLCTLAAVLDCADGQLARLRGKSSDFGRMLDGASDTLVMAAIVVGAAVHVALRGVGATRYGVLQTGWLFWPVAVGTAVVTTFHLGHYDHYKNIYLRLTEPTFREGEDLEDALARHRTELAAHPLGLFMRFVWWVYLYYVGSQHWLIHRTDPYTSMRLNLCPPHDPALAAIYRKHCLGPLRVWRTFFGLGTHVFMFSIATLTGRFDLYLLFRFGALNLLAYGVVIWWQRSASRAAFAEMQLPLPDQRRYLGPAVAPSETQGHGQDPAQGHGQGARA